MAPRYLSVDEAAAWAGVSPDTFLAEVAAGQWPPPRRRGGTDRRLTWDVELLSLWADRDSGIAPAAAAPGAAPSAAEDAARQAAEQQALKGVQRAQAGFHRNQAGPSRRR